MDIMAALAAIPGIGPALPYLTAAITVCAAFAMALPPPATGSTSFYASIYMVVNWVALNLGHAKNLTAPATPPAPTDTTTPKTGA